MRIRSVLNVLSFTLLAGFSSGCGPSWTVIKQTNPNPFIGKTAFAVDPVAFEGVTIGADQLSEPTYISKRKPEEQEKFKQSWEHDKASLAERYVGRMMQKKNGLDLTAGPAAQGGYALKTRVLNIEPGSFNGFVNFDSRVLIAVVIADPQGQALDEVQFHARVPATLTSPSVTQRLNDAAAQLADQVLSYLKHRTSAK